MAVYGLDCYSGNAVTTVTSGINRTDVVFAIAKATEGMGYDDVRHDAIEAEIQKAGKISGSYHFAWPAQDPIIEADHFVDRAKPGPGELMALDIEKQNDTATWRTRVNYTLKFLRRVLERTGTKPLVYCNLYWARNLKVTCTADEWKELSSYPLWLAHYATTPSPGKVVDSTGKDLVADLGWASTSVSWMHQYSNNIYSLDGDWFSGARTDLQTIAIPSEFTMSAEQYTTIVTKLDQIILSQSKLDDNAKLDQIVSAVNSVKTALSDNTSKLSFLQTNVSSVATTTDSIRTSVDSLGTKLAEHASKDVAGDVEAAMRAEFDSLKTAVGVIVSQRISEEIDRVLQGLPAEVQTAVKSSLQGFSINIKFPTE